MSTPTHSKPLLIFKHNPKAGGGTIEGIINEIKPNQIKSNDFIDNHYSLPNATMGKKFQYDSTHILVPEFSALKPEHQSNGFVISNIREPCSQYLSLWAFGSKGFGAFFAHLRYTNPQWTKKAYGKAAPLFNSETDIEGFRNVWMRDLRVKGTVSKRFYESYLQEDKGTVSKRIYKYYLQGGVGKISKSRLHPPSVDCWVFLEDFTNTMISCLKQFEHQGGSVNWDTPLLSKLISLQEEEKKRRRKLEYDPEDDKNRIDGSGQGSHHSKCEIYYDNNTSLMVESGDESIIYDMFGYEGCCKSTRTIVTNYTAAFLNHEHDRMYQNQRLVKKVENRPLLIFKDSNVADGGTSIFAILQAMKPNVISREKFTDGKSLTGIRSNHEYTYNSTEDFVFFDANESILTFDQKRGFVISIISEPCSQYVSIWQSGSKGKGDVFDYWQRTDDSWTEKAYGQDAPPLFDSESDIERFREVWYLKNEGLVANRFKKNYLQSSSTDAEPPVDCWVHSEDFEATLITCLQQFEEQGGSVEWTHPSMKALVESSRIKDETSGKKQNSNETSSEKYDGEINQLCSRYFDEKTAAMIQNGKESFLYTMFGFPGCCDVPEMQRIKSKTLAPSSTEQSEEGNLKNEDNGHE